MSNEEKERKKNKDVYGAMWRNNRLHKRDIKALIEEGTEQAFSI